eukprot:scaffold132289_cov60-Phaeocystis_antarctica.AAC.4
MGDLLTNFVYFTMAMYGFFSVGMISDAKVFYGADSPLCYFTVFDVSAEWFAKSCGTIIFFLIMSPFFAGVSYETYARISLPINLLQVPVFIQAAFYTTTTGPDGCTSPYAMPFNMFVPQMGIGVALLVWNVMALKEVNGISMIQAPKDGATYFCWAMALVYSVTFGSTLIIAPKFFWGPDSMFCYWEVNDESGVMFGRILGILMCSVYLAPLCEWARIEPALFRYPGCRPRVLQAREVGVAGQHFLPLLLRQGRLLHGGHRPGPQRAAADQPVGVPDPPRRPLPLLEHQGAPRHQGSHAPLLDSAVVVVVATRVPITSVEGGWVPHATPAPLR